MSKVISIMNEKGGVGKTATATTMSYLLAKKGYKILLIDFDGQANSTMICGISNPSSLKITISTLLNKIILDEELPNTSEYIYCSQNGIDLVPSNSDLFALERNLCGVNFREYKLKDYIDTIKEYYDYIIIDCMPQVGTPMINVMMCSDSIIIPTQAEILSAKGLSELLKHFNMIKKSGNESLKIEGILITMYSKRTLLSEQIKELVNETYKNKILIFNTYIPRSIKVAEANIYQKNICEYMPENPAAQAYQIFVDELLKEE